MLSLVRALASAFSVRLTILRLQLRAEFRERVLDVQAGVPDVEVRSCPAKLRHRGAVLPRRCPARPWSWSLTGKPLSRAAISMLAARRLTSHSHGPGSVSSKSLRSNTSRRSGEANTPKFDRCASPQHCTVRPERGVAGEVAGHDHGRAPVEGERRDEHAPVADRHELRHARLGLALEQLRPDRPGRAAGSKTAWLDRGTSARAALPRATRSATVGCSTTLAASFELAIARPYCQAASGVITAEELPAA